MKFKSLKTISEGIKSTEGIQTDMVLPSAYSIWGRIARFEKQKQEAQLSLNFRWNANNLCVLVCPIPYGTYLYWKDLVVYPKFTFN